MPPIANVLSIAGSDPSGGAGIQADLKSFSANGVYGMAVVTALTAQNTRGVAGVERVSPSFVAAQIDAVFADIAVDAVKIGMVATADIARAIARSLLRHGARNIVLDPVMVAKGGDRLLAEEAVEALRADLLPLCDLVTPNLPEIAALLGEPEPQTPGAMGTAARCLLACGPRAVLLKGGHLPGPECPDVLARTGETVWFEGPRHETRNTHGTGCTLSAAIAAQLAITGDLVEAVRLAKAYTAGAIAAADALSVGGGHGPTHHFHAVWARSAGAPRAAAR
ncbi:bifunctional hydroxymethylpyrimidine kinase/phosphomethylpyrimidine kinase [Aurantimonas sp. Leaf443]|uniref:bifunctional hydroxymethylpyrimidine kinase/phosphomethylpyrimidine kinase n=1 Tax=Aurantimonas sp. Leaf443 TaxID=1736378 RepID=UPI0006FAEFDF|nr:bifunctional hydroxymethylpyrimidine kinase/phosphomethylpyrimidine kinase [Aurantimonas sp. Leaf443]KQT85184.1 hydroxymethylpyrimidine/phosphomethylpyrimidine kinase [Aurantimonas sp. Leaf443]